MYTVYSPNVVKYFYHKNLTPNCCYRFLETYARKHNISLSMVVVSLFCGVLWRKCRLQFPANIHTHIHTHVPLLQVQPASHSTHPPPWQRDDYVHLWLFDVEVGVVPSPSGCGELSHQAATDKQTDKQTSHTIKQRQTIRQIDRQANKSHQSNLLNNVTW